MINDPTGELEDDNTIEEDYRGTMEECPNCGEPVSLDETFCCKQCEIEYQKEHELDELEFDPE